MKSDPKRSLREIYPRRIDVILLILASVIFFVAGLRLPVFTVRKLWESNTYSIMAGVQNLWVDKHYPLAMLILFFSVVFPIAKLTVLLGVWFVRLTDSQRKWILYALTVLGKWSMLDVFVVAVLIVWVKLGSLATASVERGIYYFAASIFLAMIVSALENALAKKASNRKEEQLTPRPTGS